jgi:hypothetical protein
MAYRHRVEAVFLQQGDGAGPVDAFAAGRQRADVDHRQVAFEEVGHAPRHFIQCGIECDAIGGVQDGGNCDDGGNLDFDGLVERALGHKTVS